MLKYNLIIDSVQNAFLMEAIKKMNVEEYCLANNIEKDSFDYDGIDLLSSMLLNMTSDSNYTNDLTK